MPPRLSPAEQQRHQERLKTARFAPIPLSDLPVGRAGNWPPARLSNNGLARYCLACPTLLSVTRTPGEQAKLRGRFCAPCKRARANLARQPDRRHTYTLDVTAVEALNELARESAKLEQQIGAAFVGVFGDDAAPDWFADLMLSSKAVASIVNRHIVPAFGLNVSEPQPDGAPDQPAAP